MKRSAVVTVIIIAIIAMVLLFLLYNFLKESNSKENKTSSLNNKPNNNDHSKETTDSVINTANHKKDENDSDPLTQARSAMLASKGNLEKRLKQMEEDFQSAYDVRREKNKNDLKSKLNELKFKSEIINFLLYIEKEKGGFGENPENYGEKIDLSTILTKFNLVESLSHVSLNTYLHIDPIGFSSPSKVSQLKNVIEMKLVYLNFQLEVYQACLEKLNSVTVPDDQNHKKSIELANTKIQKVNEEINNLNQLKDKPENEINDNKDKLKFESFLYNSSQPIFENINKKISEI